MREDDLFLSKMREGYQFLDISGIETKMIKDENYKE